MQTHLNRKASFGIETNLADEETWKFLKVIRTTGYHVHLVFLSTDNLFLLHQRINERALRGEHFVRPDIVEERYYVGLKLLRHYFFVPDIIELLDNFFSLKRIAKKNGDKLDIVASELPAWFTQYLLSHSTATQALEAVKDLSSVEEVKKRYQQKTKRQ